VVRIDALMTYMFSVSVLRVEFSLVVFSLVL
jgi:hypothetical protein